MTASPYDPSRLFHSEVDDDLLKTICRTLCKGYKDAYEHCHANFPKEQAHDLLPIYRRATVERNVAHVVTRFSDVEALPAPNSIGNCYHVRIHCGRVVLTISAVQTSREMVRDAVFRNQYARSAQKHLFDGDEPPAFDADLYGILLHGPDKRWPAYPAFLRVGFPNHTNTDYLQDPIDLKNKFPEIRNLATPDKGEQVEKIDTPSIPRIRKTADLA